MAITKGHDNNIFLVTAGGLNLFNTKTNEIRSLTLNKDNINWGFVFFQFYDSSSNQLIYGTNDRIVFIKNEIWKSDNTILPTYIDGIIVNNKNQYLNPEEKILSLNHLQKNITVNFSSNSYNENVSLSYAYKLDGIDKDWNESNTVTTANYANLIPGNYVFRVKAKNSTGAWGPENSSFKFTIHPAFWQTSWFVICCLLFVGGITYWLVRRRIKTIRKDAELKQKLTETEMLALRSQMNPHFIFNCLSAIDNLIQTNQV
ncbi:MAG: triple tyrosine motif-containing protein [Chitinophagaceae bacterium]